ncbi:MAG: DndE family protein [Myxococcales bacterium]|nr:DndE family protein [Myxococcales bacterium]
MPTSLAELQAANFRTTKQADDINTELMRRLGLRSRYEPARLAIARSLSMPEPPDVIEEAEDEAGKVIKGEHLFGTGGDLGAWIALVVEHTPGECSSRKDIQELVRRHWHRGALRLAAEYSECKEDFDRFIMHLAERAGVRESGASYLVPDSGATSRVRQVGGLQPVVVRFGEVGTDLRTQATVDVPPRLPCPPEGHVRQRGRRGGDWLPRFLQEVHQSPRGRRDGRSPHRGRWAIAKLASARVAGSDPRRGVAPECTTWQAQGLH